MNEAGEACSAEDGDKDDDHEGECNFFGPTLAPDFKQDAGWECKDGSKCFNGFDKNGQFCDILCASNGLNVLRQNCGKYDDDEEEECKFFTAFEDPNKRNGWECKDGSKCVNGFDNNGQFCDTLCASTGFNLYGQACGKEDEDDKDDEDESKKDDFEDGECKFFVSMTDPNNRNGWECKDGTKCVNGFDKDGQYCDTLCASTGFNLYGQACG